MFKGRVPDLLKKSSKHASQLSQFHNDFDESKPLILLELGQIEVILESLDRKVDRQVRSSIKETRSRIREYKDYRNKAQLWEVYVSLQKMNQVIVNLQEDQKWESNNG